MNRKKPVVKPGPTKLVGIDFKDIFHGTAAQIRSRVTRADEIRRALKKSGTLRRYDAFYEQFFDQFRSRRRKLCEALRLIQEWLLACPDPWSKHFMRDIASLSTLVLLQLNEQKKFDTYVGTYMLVARKELKHTK